ncbi:hypothetical protein EDD16DRAFT_1160535 [Pisolithus croceorrhizus]|nr:hypothetical protein EDD16DRAFT_1160535 [Pisolithus croceorrhizus]
MSTHFVDPSSLSLPMSSNEPPRKRPRSAISPEERKEARAHRNRIAAQNSRDRRKAHFSYLERRVAELEEENHRLRAGLSASPAPSTSFASDIEYEREHSRRRAEEQRERENQELRERIRSLEKGYEAVVRALAAHDSPITFANDSLDLPFSPAFSPLPSSSLLLDSPKPPLDLSLTNEAPTRHLARRVGSPRLTTGWTRVTKRVPTVRPSQRTKLHQMPSSRVCSRRSSRRRLLLLALSRVLAVRQKRRVARRC